MCENEKNKVGNNPKETAGPRSGFAPLLMQCYHPTKINFGALEKDNFGNLVLVLGPSLVYHQFFFKHFFSSKTGVTKIFCGGQKNMNINTRKGSFWAREVFFNP